ncbi:hypothetical protein [Salipaludibacillus daqingensis]|uniref:hypothetical protein n=1 Tax=Salipaludibacillus daqingensis TaxID=3041001 RepID=UPI002474B778|nr:hypothetical protein [Salipaludibacillus daqingensis]
MKKKHYLLIVICVSLLIIGTGWYWHIKGNSGISKEEAESIALEQAELDGFLSPTLWEKWNNESTVVNEFSVERNEDVRSWKVHIDTEDNPNSQQAPASIYFISHHDGEIIRVINGLQ